jgi:hypothetical protein
MPLCCQVLIPAWFGARGVVPLALPGGRVVGLVVGSGSDLSEEPTVPIAHGLCGRSLHA